jgi:hypothetical protein
LLTDLADFRRLTPKIAKHLQETGYRIPDAGGKTKRLRKILRGRLGFTGLGVYRFTGLQAYRFTGLQVYRLTGLQVYTVRRLKGIPGQH